MSWLRKLTPIVALMMCVIFVAGIGGCKTVKVFKDHDDNKQPEMDEPRPPPGPPPA
jgi:hypothetical protein